MKAEDNPEFCDFTEGRRRHLVRRAYLLCNDHYLAEDLVQETFVKLARAWNRLDRPVDKYVDRMLANEYLTSRRRRWRDEIPHEMMPERADRDGADQLGRFEDRHVLQQALGMLTPRQRATIVYRFYEDLSEVETAQALGCSVGTVKSVTSRVLPRLREAMLDGVIDDLSDVAAKDHA